MTPDPQPAAAMALLRDQVRPLVRATVGLTILTGILFPMALLGAAQIVHQRSTGSLIDRNGDVAGSEWIAQDFARPEYFHPRPSAAGESGYDSLASGGSNLGPNNPRYCSSILELAEKYRRENGLAEEESIPIEAVTRSGSGLDPHISPANASLQLPRVARERKANPEEVQKLVREHTCGRQLGFLGEPRVNVLMLNLALDQTFPNHAASGR